MSRADELGPRCLGVEDIDDTELQRVCNTIRHVVWKELGETVDEIYVMGSFARGEARDVASDLDLRIVVGTPLPEDNRERAETLLKNEYGPKATPTVCGYLDPHITVLEPGELRGATPSKRVDSFDKDAGDTPESWGAGTDLSGGEE